MLKWQCSGEEKRRGRCLEGRSVIKLLLTKETLAWISILGSPERRADQGRVLFITTSSTPSTVTSPLHGWLSASWWSFWNSRDGAHSRCRRLRATSCRRDRYHAKPRWTICSWSLGSTNWNASFNRENGMRRLDRSLGGGRSRNCSSPVRFISNRRKKLIAPWPADPSTITSVLELDNASHIVTPYLLLLLVPPFPYSAPFLVSSSSTLQSLRR